MPRATLFARDRVVDMVGFAGGRTHLQHCDGHISRVRKWSKWSELRGDGVSRGVHLCPAQTHGGGGREERSSKVDSQTVCQRKGRGEHSKQTK